MHGLCSTYKPRLAAQRQSSSAEELAPSKTAAEVAGFGLDLECSRQAALIAGARGGLATWQERKLDRHLRENLEQPLHVKDMAEQVSLSVSHFCRAFRQSFGITPHSYLIQLRLEVAQRLMLTTREPLSRIALSCGMADQAHLSKLFRRWIGESPNAWRRRNFLGDQVEQHIRHPADGEVVSRRLAA